jgi:hypothetical protein
MGKPPTNLFGSILDSLKRIRNADKIVIEENLPQGYKVTLFCGPRYCSVTLGITEWYAEPVNQRDKLTRSLLEHADRKLQDHAPGPGAAWGERHSP